MKMPYDDAPFLIEIAVASMSIPWRLAFEIAARTTADQKIPGPRLPPLRSREFAHLPHACPPLPGTNGTG